MPQQKKNFHKIAILVNNAAGRSRAKHRWEQIQKKILSMLPENTIVNTLAEDMDFDKCLLQLIEKEKVNCFISAGGDGSINFLLNSLCRLKKEETSKFKIGAIGLGSSNDFHKPFTKQIGNTPIRIDYTRSILADIGRVRFINEKKEVEERFFIVNASLGITATANQLFNRRDFFLKMINGRWTKLEILYTAIKTILTFRNFNAFLEFNDQQIETKLSNLAILKNPNVSGDFCYDQQIKIDDGRLGLNYCNDMNKFELIKVLSDLSKGRFNGYPKRHSFFVKSLRVLVDKMIPLETDGEVMTGTNFDFSIIPGGINILTN